MAYTHTHTHAHTHTHTKPRVGGTSGGRGGGRDSVHALVFVVEAFDALVKLSYEY